MNRNHKILKTIGLSIVLPLLFGIFGAALYLKLILPTPNSSMSVNIPQATSVYRSAALENVSEGFVKASALGTPAVVFIKTESTVDIQSPFGWFWDFDPFGSKGKSSGSGSGVIVKEDGYIVTNNHVINGADKITVVLSTNKTEYEAKIIGKDPSTDLALIKIEAKGLPAIQFSNSDDLPVGAWVLAVGNPFNLTSTVTAGIVSAKGRNINIVQNQFPIESFIQTDAAINPGNSGGALINIDGKLVGINTAIQSNTGSYTGYGFAIPSNIVAKVVKDFMEFGEVKRAFPGMEVTDISAEKANALGVKSEGVMVNELLADGPAEKEGILVGDVIVKMDGKPTTSKALYDEHLAYTRPGDEITFTIFRKGENKTFKIKLMSKNENNALLNKGVVSSKVLGADFQPISSSEKVKLKVKSGVRILNIRRGGYISQMGLPNGFIVIKYNNKEYAEAEDLIADMEAGTGRITIEGMDKNGNKQTLSFQSY